MPSLSYMLSKLDTKTFNTMTVILLLYNLYSVSELRLYGSIRHFRILKNRSCMVQSIIPGCYRILSPTLEWMFKRTAKIIMYIWKNSWSFSICSKKLLKKLSISTKTVDTMIYVDKNCWYNGTYLKKNLWYINKRLFFYVFRFFISAYFHCLVFSIIPL